MDGAQAVTEPEWATADLMDAHAGQLRPVLLPFRDYGGVARFTGEIVTLRVDRDWRPVLRELEQPGAGQVLVVDGGGALDRAVLGERLLGTAARNAWAGVVIHGAVRDTALTRAIPIGLRALGTNPERGQSGATAERQVPVTFGDVTFVPGERLWADADGMVVGVVA